MRAYIFAAASISLACASAVARDIFVDNLLGDDRRGGTTAIVNSESGGPCRSIAKALRITEPGDRIVIKNTGRPYRESLTLQGPRHSGSERFPTMILGNGATLDGSVSLAEFRWEFAGNNTFRTRPAHMSFQQLFVDDQPLPRRQPAPGQPPALQPLEWCLLEGWIHFRVENGKLPDSYNLTCCGEQVGITLYNVHDIIIQDLNVRRFWLDGINCHDGVRDTDLVRIGSRDNGRSGFSIGGASRVHIDTCTAAGNGLAQLHIEGYAVVESANSMLDGVTAPALIREGGKIIQTVP